jgi:hypothetical protein
MKTNEIGQRQYRRRASGRREGRGSVRRADGRNGAGKRGPSADSSLLARSTVRALVAAGAYVAQDVRDRDGLTRPMLRRAAICMAVSRQPALRRIGSAYLRSDPPAPEELPARAPTQTLPAAENPHAAAIDVGQKGREAV